MSISRWKRNCQIWKLVEGVTLDTPVKGVDYDLKYLKLSPEGRLVIRARYAWNGCTPKVAIMGMVWGTPEGALPREAEEHLIRNNLETIGYPQLDWFRPRTYYASLVHDSFYQISETHASEMDRKVADSLFLKLLKAYRFPPAKLYYAAVKYLGQLSWGKTS